MKLPVLILTSEVETSKGDPKLFQAKWVVHPQVVGFGRSAEEAVSKCSQNIKKFLCEYKPVIVDIDLPDP